MNETYKNEIENILHELGFSNSFHLMWVHCRTKIMIQVPVDIDAYDIPKILVKYGSDEQNALIRATIGINQ